MLPLKILSWNIEHFNGTGGKDKFNRNIRKKRVEKVAKYIKGEAPDVFGISEVSSSIVYEKFTTLLPDYSFHITNGRQSQEILIGVKSNLTAFFSQKDEFKRNNIYLRPGALLTVRKEKVYIPILFTHLKSSSNPEGFGLRDAMFDKIFSLKKALDSAQSGLSGKKNDPANFIVLGDMNTMGFDYYRSANDIPGQKEIDVIKKRFKRRKMKSLEKSHINTFFNGINSTYPPSELDHVFAAEHLDFEIVDRNGSELQVAGWAEKNTDKQKEKWINEFSDHAPLICTLRSI